MKGRKWGYEKDGSKKRGEVEGEGEGEEKGKRK